MGTDRRGRTGTRRSDPAGAAGPSELTVADEGEEGREANARGGIQSLDAALSVLRSLAGFPGPVSLTDIARAAGMPASKVHRYLASFIHAGFVVQRERSGRYDLGPFASEFGLAALARNDFVNRAADGLEELSQETDLTSLLTVWGNRGATVVRWQRAPSFTVTSLGLGSTLPLLTSASGRVFLAFLPRRLTEGLLRLEVERALTAGIEWADVAPREDSIAALIADTRARRLASVDGRFVPGLRAVAAPVTNWQGEAEVVVTLIGTEEAILASDSAARRHLSAFARRLSVPRCEE
jgi:DNA-binding IclR family transcriptional regulator